MEWMAVVLESEWIALDTECIPNLDGDDSEWEL